VWGGGVQETRQGRRRSKGAKTRTVGNTAAKEVNQNYKRGRAGGTMGQQSKIHVYARGKKGVPTWCQRGVQPGFGRKGDIPGKNQTKFPVISVSR